MGATFLVLLPVLGTPLLRRDHRPFWPFDDAWIFE
jgi:hypothetical protein